MKWIDILLAAMNNLLRRKLRSALTMLGVVIGTAGNVSMALDRYFDNPKGALQMFCNNAPGLWQAIGCTLAAGGSYRWYRDGKKLKGATAKAYTATKADRGHRLTVKVTGRRTGYTTRTVTSAAVRIT